jgi:signal peptidase II
VIRRLVAPLVLAGAIGATIGCDRMTKDLAVSSLVGAPGRSYLSGLVRFEYAENRGGFLGLGADLPDGPRRLLFSWATGLLLLAVAIGTIGYRLSGWPLAGAALFVAGGASNWLDRFERGSVVDFMIVGVGPVRTGIFNVADVVLMAGAAILLVAEYRAWRLRAAAPPQT